jgi:hypothetical protein
MTTLHLSRRLAALVVAPAAAVLIAGVSFGATAAKRHAFTESFVGAQINGSLAAGQDAYKVSDTLNGPGAAVQTFTLDTSKSPVTGSDTTRTYFANGVSLSQDTFTVGNPDAKGVGTLTGKGHCTGGTRVHSHEKCTYTFTGSYDAAGHVRVKIKGTSIR